MPPRLADEPRRGEEAIRGGRGPERTPMTSTKTTKSATLDGVSERPEPDGDAVDRLAGLLPRRRARGRVEGP